ncbi:unnamed protein product [Cuscuta epithymum]|uniref:Zinc knuckle CX2CX4HX4C domain-containing protein n=1 Tax=Cuscuta epithymum TaxID=186058 RepID=A0AAV0CJS0_9ASTE|nr:unnamed protein product [Cuscuta epithymum]
MRVRVLMKMDKSLKKATNLKKDGKSFWVDFKYERLPNFCFICGLIGHSDNFCPSNYEEGLILEKRFGIHLRAGSGVKTSPTGGHKWLLDGSSSSGRMGGDTGATKSEGKIVEKEKVPMNESAHSFTKGGEGQNEEVSKSRKIWETQTEEQVEDTMALDGAKNGEEAGFAP